MSEVNFPKIMTKELDGFDHDHNWYQEQYHKLTIDLSIEEQ
jgi:hypothetical protein